MAASSPMQALFDPFQYLPTELVLKILKHFCLRELAPCMLVSKTWNEIASDPSRFRRLKVGCRKSHGGKFYDEDSAWMWNDDLEPSECRQLLYDSQFIAKAQGRLISVTIETHPVQAHEYLKLVGSSQHGSDLTTLNLRNANFNPASPNRDQIFLNVSDTSACSKALQKLYLYGWEPKFPQKTRGFTNFVQLSRLSLDHCDIYDCAPLPSTLKSLSVRFSRIAPNATASWAASDLPNLETIRWETEDSDWEPVAIPRLSFTVANGIFNDERFSSSRASRIRELQLLVHWRDSGEETERFFDKNVADLVSAYAETLESCTIKLRTIPPGVLDTIATQMPNITNIDLSCEEGIPSPVLRVFADRYSSVHGITSERLKVKANVFLTGSDAADGLKEGFKRLVDIRTRYSRGWDHLRSRVLEYCDARGLQVDGYFTVEIYRPHLYTPDSSDEDLVSRYRGIYV